MAKFSSCYQCKNRELGCHSTCELYLAEVDENNKRLEMLRNIKNEKDKDMNYHKESYKRAMNRRKPNVSYRGNR